MDIHGMLARMTRHPSAPASQATAAGANTAPGTVAAGGRNPQFGSALQVGPGRLAASGGAVGMGGDLRRVQGVQRRAIDSGVTMGLSTSFDSAFTHRLSGRHTVIVNRPKQGTVRPDEAPRAFGGTKAPRYAADIPGVNAGFPAPPASGCS